MSSQPQTVTEDSYSPVQRDILDLNMSWLFALREAARDDVQSAAVRFGVDRETASLVAESSVDEVRKMADPSIALFQPANLFTARGSVRNLGRSLRGDANAHNRYVLSSIAGATE